MLMESIMAKHEERRFWHVLLSFSSSFLAACSVPLGLSTGEIKDWQITASSIDEQRREQCQASFVRLYSNGNDYAWCPRINQPHQWIQVDLGTPTKVSDRSQLLEEKNELFIEICPPSGNSCTASSHKAARVQTNGSRLCSSPTVLTTTTGVT